MNSDEPAKNDAAAPHAVSFGEALRVWLRVACLSFGGPAAQIAVMHRILVDEKKWISEGRFLHALNYCMLLPGPEAQQLATYMGWLLNRTVGGVVAGSLFVLPGFLSILGLSLIYSVYHDAVLVQGLFFGLKPAVMAIVVEAVIRIGKRVLKNRVMDALAAAAFVAIFVFGLPFPLIIGAAAAIGFFGGQFWPKQFHVLQGHKPKPGSDSAAASPAIADLAAQHARPSIARSCLVLAVCLTLWFGPLLALAARFGRDHTFVKEGVFFSKVAVVTFGGAYSVLSYVQQQAVDEYHWLDRSEMIDGMGMAETTPGPLIQVVQFVGYMGAYRQASTDGAGLRPITAGIIASVVTTWVTYVPCFLWILLGAPYMERLRGVQSLNAALSAITAAVVGVVLNLAVSFSLVTLFGPSPRPAWFVLQLPVIDVPLNTAALVIAIAAFALIFYFKRGMMVTLAVCAALGLAFHLAS